MVEMTVAGRAIIEIDQDILEAQALLYDNGSAFVLEVGYRAWTWGQDVSPFEANYPEDVATMIAGTTPAEGW